MVDLVWRAHWTRVAPWHGAPQTELPVVNHILHLARDYGGFCVAVKRELARTHEGGASEHCP